MGNYAKKANKGLVCPVRGCDKKDNRRFRVKNGSNTPRCNWILHCSNF